MLRTSVHRLRHLLRTPEVSFHISPFTQQIAKNGSARQVTFKRPWARRFLVTFICYGVAFHVWSSFVLLHLEEAVPDDETGPLDTVTGEDDDANDQHAELSSKTKTEPIFIPLGWPRLRKGELYQRDSPEWLEYRKFAADSSRFNDIKADLASTLLAAARQSDLRHKLGTPCNVTRYWFEPTFPRRAPPFYERQGLEIGNGTFTWVARPMAPADGEMWRRCLKPVAVSYAIKDASSVFFSRQFARFKAFVGLDDDPASSISVSARLSRTGLPGPALDNGEQASRMDPQSQACESLHDDISPRRLPQQTGILSSLDNFPLMELGPGSDIHGAALAFERQLRVRASRELSIPRRGTMFLSGPIGLKGPKGFCRIEVVGEYDPLEKKWVQIRIMRRRWNS